MTKRVIAIVAMSFPCFASTLPMPKASDGVINGRVAIVGVPVSVDRHGKVVRSDAKDCEVHLAKTEDETIEHVYPCGTWFQPPVGRYLFWLEAQSSVSFQSVIHYGGERFTRSGAILSKTLYPAGFIQLDAKTDVPSNSTFRLLSLEAVKNYRPFDRRIMRANANRRVRLPVGAAIGGVFDRAGRALSLSRPQRIDAGKTTLIAPEKQGHGRAGLLIVLARFVARPPVPRCDSTLLLHGRPEKRPAVNLQAYDRVVLAWYGVSAPAAGRLQVRCAETTTFARDVYLAGGEIETLRADLPKSEQRAR